MTTTTMMTQAQEVEGEGDDDDVTNAVDGEFCTRLSRPAVYLF
jgi:hypothetical protein